MMGCSTLLLALACAGPVQGEVVLPLSAYNALVAQAAGERRGDEEKTPPVASSVREASYSVTSDGPVARIKMTAVVDVLSTTPVMQPLLGSSAALLSVTVNGQPAGVLITEERYAIPLKRGTHTVAMEVVVPVQSEGPSELGLSVPEALAAKLTADLPGAPLAVTVEGVEDVETRAVNGRTHVNAALPVGSSLNLSWVRQGEDGAPEEEELEDEPPPPSATPGKARAVVLHHLAVAESVIRGTLRATLSVQKGTRNEVRFTLPATVEVLDVQSTDLREWTATAEGGLKTVLVSFKYGRSGEVVVTARYERPLKEGADASALAVPEVTILGVESERGFLGVEAAPGVEVAMTRSDNAEALEGRDLPSDLWSMSSTPLVLGVKYLEHPVNVVLNVSQRAKVAVADTTLDRVQFETVLNSEGRAVSAVTFQVRNHQRQYLEVKLPTDTTVLSCFVSGKAVRPARGNKETLFIPLDRSTAAEGAGATFPVELVIAQDTGSIWPLSSLRLQMPATSVQAMDLGWRVFIPASHMALTFGGNFSLNSDPRSIMRWFAGLVSSAPEALAGGMASKRAASLEGYDFSQNVKARFAAKQEDAQVVSAVRMSRPLFGRQYEFRANLLRAEVPTVAAILIHRDTFENLGRLAILLTAVAALLIAHRRSIRARKIACPEADLPNPETRPFTWGPTLLAVAIPLSLLTGLYLDGVVMGTALGLLMWPGWRTALLMRQTSWTQLPKLAWPLPLFTGLLLGLTLVVAVLGQSLVGALFFLLLAMGLEKSTRMLAKKRAAATAAPPSGTPVAAMSGSNKSQGGAP